MMDPLTHDQAQQLLQAGEKLNNGEQQVLEAHLATCTECRAYAKETDTLSRELPIVFRSRPFSRKEIMQKSSILHRKVFKSTRKMQVWRAVTAGIGLLVLFGLIILAPRLLPQTASPSETSTTETGTPSLAVTTAITYLAEEMTVNQPEGSPWTTYIPSKWSEALQQGQDLPSISSILPASVGSVWFASMGGATSVGTGAYRYIEQGWVHLTAENGLPADEISDMVTGPDGAVWFSSLCCGVARFDGFSWTLYTTGDGLASNDVRSIAVAPDGAIWFGTSENGVSRYADGTWQTFTTADGLYGNYVGNIFVLPDRSLLLSTSDGQRAGLNRFDGQTWSEYTTEWSDTGHYTQNVALA